MSKNEGGTSGTDNTTRNPNLATEEETNESGENPTVKTWTAEETKKKNDFYTKLSKSMAGMNKSYPMLNGRSIIDCVGDWRKRWNGFVPFGDTKSSKIFLNLTRNIIISYLSKVAVYLVRISIIAVNKAKGYSHQDLAQALTDLNKFSLNEEKALKKWKTTALNTTVDGTAYAYEGYLRLEREREVISDYDVQTGEYTTKTEKVILFDNCFQETIPIEEVIPTNPFEPEMNNQVIFWRKIMDWDNFRTEFKDYENYEYVKKGAFSINILDSTIYTPEWNQADIQNKVEVIRCFNPFKGKMIIYANGISLYDGPNPYKHGKCPIVKYVFETVADDFFWGMGFPNKIMGEQDLLNTFINLMADKTIAAMLPMILTSDMSTYLDDEGQDLNKFKQVSNVDKWKSFETPPVSAGESNVFNLVLSMIKENAGTYGGSNQMTNRGGRLQSAQVQLAQQEAEGRIGFSMANLEDGETVRTELRISNILQFYSIPLLKKVTGKDGSTFLDAFYRDDIRLNNEKLSSGKSGTRVYKLYKNIPKGSIEKIKKQLTDLEYEAQMNGELMEALALDLSTFNDYNSVIQVVPSSSYEKQRSIEQAVRKDYAQWKLQFMESGLPIDLQKLVDWVDESYDVEVGQFTIDNPEGQKMLENTMSKAAAGGGASKQGTQKGAGPTQATNNRTKGTLQQKNNPNPGVQ